jgi:hypothetical protein
MLQVLHLVVWFATLVFNPSLAADGGQCNTMKPGVTHAGLYVPDAVFKRLGTTDLITCVTQCMMHVSCRGINHHANEQECELLNVNVTSSLSNGTVPRDGYITSDIHAWPKVMYNV